MTPKSETSLLERKSSTSSSPSSSRYQNGTSPQIPSHLIIKEEDEDDEIMNDHGHEHGHHHDGHDEDEDILDEIHEIPLELKEKKRNGYKTSIVWRNVVAMIVLHVLGFYGFYLSLIGEASWKSIIWFWAVGFTSGFGILTGAHRLWAHKSYKANLPLRFVLMILQTVALQNDIYEWCRDHRVHHKYSETDADPHNSNRGFFFAHMGWLLCKKHPDVKEKGSRVDMSDLWSDPIVRFQRRFYIPLVLVFWGILPTMVAYYFFNESLLGAICGNFFRYVITLHNTWLVNSAAHIFGTRPYDKTIRPRENKAVVYLSMGEGYHNYHHTFPWDYSASEFGYEDNFNPATAFIDLFCWLGWVSDRKVPSKEMILKRMKRTGEKNSGSMKLSGLAYWADTTTGFAMIFWPIVLVFVIRCVYSFATGINIVF